MNEALATRRISEELMARLGTKQQVQPFQQRYPGFDLIASYDVVAQVRDLRRARGEKPVGRKIGFTNRSIWTPPIRHFGSDLELCSRSDRDLCRRSQCHYRTGRYARTSDRARDRAALGLGSHAWHGRSRTRRMSRLGSARVRGGLFDFSRLGVRSSRCSRSLRRSWSADSWRKAGYHDGTARNTRCDLDVRRRDAFRQWTELQWPRAKCVGRSNWSLEVPG